MFNVEIGQNRDATGWVATLSFTLKNELVSYQPAKVCRRTLEARLLSTLMYSVVHLTMKSLCPKETDELP